MSDKKEKINMNKEEIVNIENKETIAKEEVTIIKEEIAKDIHLEMRPNYEWGQIINKSKGPLIVDYNNTKFNIAINGISDTIRKDLIEKTSTKLYQWKKV